MIIVDVHVWQAKLKSRSVGHVMVTGHCSHIVYLSQYPHVPGGASTSKGPNVRYTYAQTYAAQARLPSAVFMVTLPDDAKFRGMVRDHQDRKFWKVRPNAVGETHCARAAADALSAGGLKSLAQLDDGFQIFPDELYGYLSRIAFYQQGQPQKVPWRVSLRSGNACIR
jgi:hypothetical protein